MTGPTELHECGRCHHVARDIEVRLWWAPSYREAREDGRIHEGPPMVQDYRCRDTTACSERAKRETNR